MNRMKVLDQKSKREGNTVIVTKTVEEALTQNDIYQLKQQLNNQKQNLLQQMDQFQERINIVESQERELDSYLAMLEEQPKN
jgi:hypothetical protein